jgi:DNA polymerase III subunit alpha
MSDKNFVHLHVHSQYSLLEATCDPESLAEKVKELGQSAVALTDYGNMFGAIEFYFACQKAGVKPIIGLEVYLAPKTRHIKGDDPDAAKVPNRRLVLLAQNYEGYQTLCKISSIGYQEGFYYRPRIDDEVLAANSENIIVLSGSFMGDIPYTYRTHGAEKALERIKFYKKTFGDRFYLELNKTGLKEWDEINPFLVEAGKKHGVKCVATNDVHYLNSGDHVSQEVLICIGSNKTLQDPSRYRLGSEQFYMKSSEQMAELFKDHPEACANTLEVADRINIKFNLKSADGKPIYHLPTLPTKGGVSLEEEIARLSREGLEKRFIELARQGETVPEEEKPKYFARLDYELSVISKMGFISYFLIVMDFIRWSKSNDIPVGPGRGSGAGSLVAYALDITDLNPLPYNLIFERFLNPERISMPDFDIDFCQENRHRVINYVTEKYGQKSVSQIITYGKLQARAAIRDVGRVMGMLYSEVDVVAKLIPEKLNITLKEAIETEPRLKQLMEDEPRVGTLMELAQNIEGTTRHAGIHAAGVIIADGDLVSLAPLYRGTDGENVVQFDMKHAEKIGLIKFDFLGLKTLTLIQDAIRLIKQNRTDEKGNPKVISTKDISLRDPGIYEIMGKGDTAGVFQFEGEGITDTMRKVLPNCFEDIVAVNALYRPGPMDMIPDYIDRKHGRKKVTYAFPQLEEVLRETYGVIVYQEQVQLIAARIAGYSLGEADVLRRAMGKKDANEMARQKERFAEGAAKNGHDPKKAADLFDLMAKFAEYGFNKSHAAAYCVVAAHTAYLKNYFPVEFYAALLSTEMGDTDKIVKYVKDARKRGLRVEPPNVSHSDYKFNVKEDVIYFSLGAIKGVGEAAVQAILEAREAKPSGKFESLDDFFGSVDLRRVNKKTIECLIKAGALDHFGFNRAEMMNGYARFIERLDSKRKDAASGQVSLFEMTEETKEEKVQLEKMTDWTRSARLAYEKEVLGFYLSGHPLDVLDQMLRPWTTGTIAEFEPVPHKSKVTIVCVIATLKEIITKKGTRMAFGQAEDTTGSVELIIFPDTFAQYEMALKADTALLVQGTLEKEEQSPKVIVEKIQRVDDVLKQAKRITLQVNDAPDAKMALLKEVMMRNPGTTTFILQLCLKEMNKVVDLQVNEPRGIELSKELFDQIGTLIDQPKMTLL